jgi:hypothetical protein
MNVFLGWQGRPSEPTRLRTGLCAAVVSSLAGVACSEGTTEPPSDNAGTSSMSGSGGSATGNTGGSGNATGGTSGAGGSGGAGGSTGGGSVEPSTFHNFDTSQEGFRINYVCTAAAVCMSIQPGMAPAAVDAGADGGGAPPSQEPDNGLATATWDSEVGSPQPGSVRVEIDFTAPGQIAVLALNFDTTDFTGRTMSALVTVDAGAPAQLVGKMYMKTGETYVYADSGERPLPPDTWTSFSISADLPMSVANGTHNAADTREIGIEFATPMATAFSTAVIHVDAWQY